MLATFQGSLEVYFNPSGLANVLSLGLVSDLWRVTIDNSVENAICVHFPEEVWKFVKFGVGLYYNNTLRNPSFDKHSVKHYSFVSTIETNQKKLQRREVEQADLALEVHAKLGRPSQRIFEKI